MSDDEYFDGEYCERCEKVFDEGEIAFYEDDEGNGIWCCDDCLDVCSSYRRHLQSWEKHLRAHDHWVRDRWGGFTYLVIGRNEDFMLDFKEGSLWLHYESDTRSSPVGRVLLLEQPTRQGVVDAERMFGCI